MARRKKPGQVSRARQERERVAHEKTVPGRIVRAYHKRPKTFIAVVAMLVVFSAFVAFTAGNAPPFDYVQCLDSTMVLAQHKHAQVFIQVGERRGSLDITFVRLPDNMGVGSSCSYPIHVHESPGARGNFYTTIHIESPYQHAYTLGDMFEGWGEWLGYQAPVYFAADGVSYYRSQQVDLFIHRGPVIDPLNNTYSQTTRSYAYGGYVIQDGDLIEIIVRDPYTEVTNPY